jgi:hypothetical protein
MAYGIANDGAAAPDGLPKNPIARLVFVKTAQSYLPSIPLALQKLTFACADKNYRHGKKLAGLLFLGRVVM